MTGFMCNIVTPQSMFVSEEVTLVVVPGIEGEEGFLRGHIALISVLEDGVARVVNAADKTVARYALQDAYVQVKKGNVVIVAQRACCGCDVDVDWVREQLSAVDAKIAELSDEELAKTTLLADRSWYKVQLKAAQAA